MLISQFIIVTISALLHGGWNFYAKRAPQKLEIITLAVGFASVLFFPVLFMEAAPPSSIGILLAIGTGLIQAIYLIMLYRAYDSGSLTVVYPLSRGFAVLCTFLIEYIYITPSWTLGGIIGILTISFGTGCLAVPHLGGNERKGVIYSLAIGLLLGLAFLLGRYSSKYITPVSYLWGMYASSTIILLAVQINNFRSRFIQSWTSHKGVVAVIGIGSFISYFLVVYLFRTLPAAKVVAIRELSVVFAAILGFIFLKEKMSFLKVVSILAITAGAIMLKFK